MPAFIDIAGQKFGRWTVQHRHEDSFKWWCVCECGVRKKVFSMALRNGASSSCGCYAKEVSGVRIAALNYRHGANKDGVRDPVYSVWASMKARCDNPKTPNFAMYGGRGIKVCESWRDFVNFASDMGPRPDGCSIERRDNDGDYSPSNCHWATRKEQNRNQRKNRMLTLGARTLCVTEWEEVTGISEAVIRQRMTLGWSDERTLTEPVKQLMRNQTFTINGVTKLTLEWAKEYGMDPIRVRRRLALGWTPEQALSKAVRPKRRST